jgi:hypothetical protein
LGETLYFVAPVTRRWPAETAAAGGLLDGAWVLENTFDFVTT